MPVEVLSNNDWGYPTYNDYTAKKEPQPKYKIWVGGNLATIQLTLDKLFKHGYVFDSTYRYRDFNTLREAYSGLMTGWEYIRTRFDPECKMVIGRIKDVAWNSEKLSFKTVTLDEFLYEIAGHEKPKDNVVVLVDEFNKEFEEFRKKNLISLSELQDVYNVESVTNPTIEHIQPPIQSPGVSTTEWDSMILVSPNPIEEEGTPSENVTGGFSNELRNIRRIRLRRIRRRNNNDA